MLGVLGQKKWRKLLVENLEMNHARTTVGEVSCFQQLYEYMGAANGQPRARLNQWLGGRSITRYESIGDS